MKLAAVAVVFLATSGCTSSTSSSQPAAPDKPVAGGEIVWRDWSQEAFAEARAKNKLVLLDLGTAWCHWCHVMDETTYKDPIVVALIREHVVALRVDADAKLDLANRYEDYGWPATILFDGKGTELAKFRGYIRPERMASILRGFIADPTPGPSAVADPSVAAASSSALTDEMRTFLFTRYVKGYDEARGGWGDVHKFVDLDAVELAMRKALLGDDAWGERAKKTLDAEKKFLIDPVWGGAYQYSDSGVWENPHFEKIMSRQSADMVAFSLAYARWHDPAHLAAARDVERYVTSFLMSPEGTFYSNQDADLVKGEHSGECFKLDDAGRRKLGVPAVDKHVYARENGWAIEALSVLHCASGDEGPLARAVHTAEKICASHSVPGGGFKHDASDPDVYLADTLAMGRALLALHRATGDKKWLDRSAEAARFVAKTFAAEVGFATAPVKAGDVAPPRPEVDENVAVARWMNLLHHETGDASFREHADRAMRYIANPATTSRRGHYVSGPLLADLELREEPLHVTIVGDGDGAKALLRAALALPSLYVVVERQGGAETQALLCAKGACKPPIRDPEKLTEVALGLMKE